MLTSSGSYLALALPPLLRQPWAMLPLAGLVAAGFGILFGLPTIRTRGEYLAIVTLAFGVIVPGVIWHLPYWTGGPNGLSGVPLPRLLPLDPGLTTPCLRACARARRGRLRRRITSRRLAHGSGLGGSP